MVMGPCVPPDTLTHTAVYNITHVQDCQSFPMLTLKTLTYTIEWNTHVFLTHFQNILGYVHLLITQYTM